MSNVFDGGIKAVDPGQGLGDKLQNKVVMMRPMRKVRVQNDKGDDPATVTFCVEIHQDGTYDVHGEITVFWKVVQQQLDTTTEEYPWLVGRVVKQGRYWQMNPPSPAQAQIAAQVLEDLRRQPPEHDQAPAFDQGDEETF